MTDLMKILDRRYGYIGAQTNTWDFLVGVMDYVSHIIINDYLTKIILEVVTPRDNAEKKLKELERNALASLSSVEDIVRSILPANHGVSKLDEDLKEITMWRDGHISGSQKPCEAIEWKLVDTIRWLFENGHTDGLDKFVRLSKGDNPVVDRVILSDEMEEYKRVKKEHGYNSDIALWNDWNELAIVNTILVEGDEKFQKAKESGRMFECLNMSIILSERNQIRQQKPFGGDRTDIVHLKREKILKHLERIHLHILQVDNQGFESTDNRKRLLFESSMGTLFIDDKQARISSGKRNNPHILLDIIKDDWTKEWEMEDLQHGWGDSDDDRRDETYYKAAYDTNQKIKADTGIDDFLITSKMAVKVNSKYMPELPTVSK